MLCSPYAFGTRTELWFGRGCCGRSMLVEHEGHYCFGMDALVAVCSWKTSGIMVWASMLWSPSALETRTELWFGNGCSAHRVFLEHERNHGLGTDALVIECPWNTNGRVLRVFSGFNFRRTESWFGHGCSGHRMPLEHERKSAQGILRLQLQCPSFLYVLTIRLPRLCTAVWPRRGFDSRSGRSLQETRAESASSKAWPWPTTLYGCWPRNRVSCAPLLSRKSHEMLACAMFPTCVVLRRDGWSEG